MAAKFKLPRCGDVEIYTGLMGSGKSFLAVCEVLDIITRERRPVFTNLPIRWRVFRQHLRNQGGEALANLIFPLTEQHFRRFVQRQAKRLQFRDELRMQCQAEGRPFRETEFRRLWYEHAGPDITRGVDAQWVDPLAVIVIDEVHHWFPQSQQQANKDFLAGYLTMLLHHLQRIVVISQSPMQVDICFRRLASYYTEVTPQAEEKLAWGLRCKHLGIRGIHYERFTADVYDDERLRATIGPVKKGLVFLWLPAKRFIFRLYDSFTHVGGVRQMVKTLREVRVAAGLDPDGEYDMGERVIKVYRWRPAFFAAFLAFVAGGLFGAREWGSLQEQQAAELAAAEAVVPVEVVPLEGKLSGIAGRSVVVDGSIKRIGDTHAGYELVRIADGWTLWASPERLWRWEPGAAPVDLGTPERVAELLASRLGGGPVGDGKPLQVGTVGTRGRDDLDGGPGADLDGGGPGG